MIRTIATIGALAAAAGCASPSYLGAGVPAPCTAHDAEHCLGWMAERDLAAADLDLYRDGALRDYVQQVADRIAGHSLLDGSPRVIIADRDETYATSGHRIVIARRTLEKLGSEAELAAVIAHELAHVEGHHGVVSLFGRPPDDDFKNRRDAEAIADERAVWLLERAGYAPTAMASALRAVLEQEDDEHPLRADRIARATVLAGGRTGFVGRDELLGHLAHMVIGADPRLGARIGASWVVAALGLAIDLEDGDLVRADHDVLALSRDRSTLIAYAVGAPWGRELAARLEDREVIHADAGDIAVGTVPYRTRHPDQPLAKLAAAVRSTLPQPAPGTRVAIAVSSPGALVIEIGGRAIDSLTVREATADEIAATEPARLVIVHAPRTGIVEQLHACAFPLDPDRRVAAGEAIKCSDRRPLDESNL